MDKNYLIGKNNKLPWKVSAEMKYFSQVTSGNTILMGSKTFESIGKPLKNRFNIVITRNKEKYQNWQEKNLIFTDELERNLRPYKDNPNKHVFIIGGREIYQQTCFYANYYYVSVMRESYEGNIFLPFSGWDKGKLIRREEFPDFTAYVYKNLCQKEIII